MKAAGVAVNRMAKVETRERLLGGVRFCLCSIGLSVWLEAAIGGDL